MLAGVYVCMKDPTSSSSSSFAGFIRIHMNLTRPITISLSRQLLSLAHSDVEDDAGVAGPDAGVAGPDASVDGVDDGGVVDDEKCLSFYLPHGTSKVIHVDR